LAPLRFYFRSILVIYLPLFRILVINEPFSGRFMRKWEISSEKI